MNNERTGWAWFEQGQADVTDEGAVEQSNSATARAFARCFRGEDGRRVMVYLRSITAERVLGPTASDSMLRHLEGQRCLVNHMAALVARGNGTDNFSGVLTGFDYDEPTEHGND